LTIPGMNSKNRWRGPQQGPHLALLVLCVPIHDLERSTKPFGKLALAASTKRSDRRSTRTPHSDLLDGVVCTRWWEISLTNLRNDAMQYPFLPFRLLPKSPITPKRKEVKETHFVLRIRITRPLWIDETFGKGSAPVQGN
jgi:hypothetical protein